MKERTRGRTVLLLLYVSIDAIVARLEVVLDGIFEMDLRCSSHGDY